MIISRTPYRVSLAGGGTDMPTFFEERSALIVNAALNRHVYVCLTSRLDDRVRLAYSRTEFVANAGDLRHEIARAVLLRYGLRNGLEIGMTGEVSGGTGLGSSSAVTVGLLHAVRRRAGLPCDAATLAAEAVQVETELLRRPIGWQDQYGVAFPTLKAIAFGAGAAVRVTPIALSTENRKALESSALLVSAGHARSADSLMLEQTSRMRENRGSIEAIADIAQEVRSILEARRIDLPRLGALLDENWRIKRTLGANVTNPAVDALYDAGKAAGAWGGKLLGAGAGGFLLFLIPAARQAAMLERMGRPPSLPLALDDAGAAVVYDNGDAPRGDAARMDRRLPVTMPPPVAGGVASSRRGGGSPIRRRAI